MRKHGILTLALVLLLSLVLAGCGSTASEEPTSPFVGKWVATEAAMNGISINVTDIAGDLNIVIDAKGKAVASIEDTVEEGTWEESEDGTGFTVHLSDLDFVFTANEDGTMSTDYEDITFTFELADEEDAEEAEEEAAEEETTEEPLSDSEE